MIEPGVRPCPVHRGEPADHCGLCRSERISDPAAEPENIPTQAPFQYTPEEWQERLRVAVEATLRKRAARKAERAEFKRRRDYGLNRRHAEKLARNRQEENAMPDVPPCCAGPDEPCPQHRQAAALQRSGPRNRSGRPQVVVGEPGKARPAPDPEENR